MISACLYIFWIKKRRPMYLNLPMVKTYLILFSKSSLSESSELLYLSGSGSVLGSNPSSSSSSSLQSRKASSSSLA